MNNLKKIKTMNRMQIIKMVFGIIFFVHFHGVFSQQIAVHSPTAANLGLYGEIPVSYYTGTPNISIDLYEIKGKHINVPIEITYHPSGIRPEIHPGPVGLGWSLHAGGVISRTVRGNGPDESEFGIIGSDIGNVAGYLKYAKGWIAQGNWKDNAKNSMENDCLNCSNVVNNMAPYSDTEPDEFSFSFSGYSGKFYFDHNGNIQVQCDKPVKVAFNNEFIKTWEQGIELDYSYTSNTQRAFKSFNIIDEHGTIYNFGGASAIEFSDPISYGRDEQGMGVSASGEFLQATSWFLTQIKSADGTEEVNFEYERGPFICQLYRSFDFYDYSGANKSGSRYNSILKDGTLISPVYLKGITSSGGENIMFSYGHSDDLKYTDNDYHVVFFYNNTDNYKLLEMTNAIPRFNNGRPNKNYDRIQWLKLDTVIVRNMDNQPVKQVSFTYNNTPSERLFLESLHIYGKNDRQSYAPIEYAFTYKNRNLLPTAYLKCITDHWGFNNGQLYPSNGFNSQNKEPNAFYTDSGVLSEIRYPTKGTVRFEYELNDYAKVIDTKNRTLITSQSGKASGLRIKKIVTDNLAGNSVNREFFYKESPTSSVSSGILNMMPKYTYSINSKDCTGKSFSINGTRSMPVIPLGKDNEGLFVGYTYVCEQVSGGNGYTQYLYTNHDNGHPDFQLANGKWNRDIFPSDSHCSRYFERGRLKKETFYNSNDQQVSVNETVWGRYGSQGEDNPRAFHFGGLGIGYGYCSSVAYLHFCYKFLPSQRNEIVYDLNGQNPVTTKTIYEYNPYGLVKKNELSASDNTVRRQEMKYPSDFQTSPYPQMLAKNILSPVVETSVFINGVFIEKTSRDYAIRHNTLYVPVNLKYQKGSSTAETRETYSYDLKGNIRELQRNSADKIVYLWGYNYQYPIAEISNATYAQVIECINETTLAGIAVKKIPSPSDITLINGLRSKLPNAQVISYTYEPLVGMTSKTLPNGITTYYEYDTFGRLMYVKDNDGKILERHNYHYRY